MLDLKKLKDSFDGDEEILDAIAKEFIKQLPEELELLDQLLKEEDINGVKIKAHTLKGLAGTFYSESAKSVAGEMELAANNTDMSKVQNLSDKLKTEFENLLAEVKEIVGEDV